MLLLGEITALAEYIFARTVDNISVNINYIVLITAFLHEASHKI